MPRFRLEKLCQFTVRLRRKSRLHANKINDLALEKTGCESCRPWWITYGRARGCHEDAETLQARQVGWPARGELGSFHKFPQCQSSRGFRRRRRTHPPRNLSEGRKATGVEA